MEKILNYINGTLTEPLSGNFFNNINPAEGKPYSLIPDSDKADIDKAATAAKEAFKKWSNTPAKERSAILINIANLIDRDLNKLALAESMDQGKPVKLARSLDIPRAAANIRFYATAILHEQSTAHFTDSELSIIHTILLLE
jgi:aminomuconate-semialdehyde/2-hydroxymuconate-6-semialdehyde dehydrogenase